MEFCQKLQNLRKSKGLSQEELAESLYVSRTAISKWESGRGYPSIDSIKEISSFFSITIDELLSSEKILSLAEKENKQNIQNVIGLLFGFLDMFAIMLIALPLYPQTIGEHIYSVSLPSFTEISFLNAAIYWTLYILLIITGILKICFTQLNMNKVGRIASLCSMVLGTLTVLFLILSRQVYATTIMFALLVIKVILYIKYIKN